MEQKEKASNQSCCKRNGETHTCPSRSREAKPTYWTEYWIKTESPDIRRNGKRKEVKEWGKAGKAAGQMVIVQWGQAAVLTEGA